MRVKKRPKIEFRYYNMPNGSYVFALTGKEWIREYGDSIDFLHFHNFMEIGHCISGCGDMILGNQKYSYRSGDFTVIPKNYLHTTNSLPNTKSHWEYLFIDELSFIERIYFDMPLHKRNDKFLNEVNSQALFFSRDDYPKLSGYILELISCIGIKDTFYKEEISGLLTCVLTNIAKINDINSNMTAIDDKSGIGKASRIIMKAMDYVGEHYTEDLRIEDLAQSCYMSETHFRRLFAKYMNMGVLEYINRVRISAACELLKRTDYSVADIANKCGFSTLSTFNRNFKHILDTNPYSWRKLPENYEQILFKYKVDTNAGW